MVSRISERDKVVLNVGAILVMILLFINYVAIPALGRYKNIRSRVKSQQALLEDIGLSDSKQAQDQLDRLAKAVPSFALPQSEDQQRQLFLEKFYEQLRRSRIRVTSPPQFQTQVRPHPDKNLGLNILRLKCRGTCSFSNAMDLLATLYENPYLYTIEEMHLICGERNRNEIDLTLVVSTLCLMQGS